MNCIGVAKAITLDYQSGEPEQAITTDSGWRAPWMQLGRHPGPTPKKHLPLASYSMRVTRDEVNVPEVII